MRIVIDTNGREWEVGTVTHNQINIGPIGSGGNHRGLSLPNHLIRAWIAGEIKVKVTAPERKEEA